MQSTTATACLLLALLWPLAGSARVDAPRAEGGVRLVEAMESAPLTLVGSVREPRRLDAHGHTARIEIESVLAGEPSRAEPLQIAWEELAASRAGRFQEGERVLLCLEPLPGASIWIGRFPEPALRQRVLTVALQGDAFLRDPSLGTLGLLEHYLAMARPAREGEPGSRLLALLVAGAELPIAIDAARRLAARSRLAEVLDAAATEQLVAALLRSEASPALEDAVVALIAEHRLEQARPLLTRLAAARPRPPPVVYAALASLSDGLALHEVEELLAEAPARYRELAARQASGAGAEALLRGLAREDREPAVRAAALSRLLELEGAMAVDALAEGLGDADAHVRQVAVHALARLGDAAVPSLRSVVDAGEPQAARAAVATLGLLSSSEARALLTEIADANPDEGLRALAALALGRPLGHVH